MRTVVVLSIALLQACSRGSVPPAVSAPDTTPPTVPQGLTLTAVSATRIELSWSAATDAGGAGLAGYQVIRDGAQLAVVAAPATSYSDLSVVAATAYTYTVRAFDRASPPNLSADAAARTVTTPVASPLGGLDARPSNATCLAPARPQAAAAVQVNRVFPNLSFTSPVGLLQAPADATRWFVVEQGGRVRVFSNAAGVAQSGTFVDLTARVVSGGERGLLGMAFHPDWPRTPEAFLSYTRPSPRLQSVVARFLSRDGGATLDAASEQVLLTVDQPETNHNGGHAAFGPDGYLYLGLGDGGGGGDAHGSIGNGQDLKTLLGKMLRIEVRGTGAGYAIPADNPFAQNARCATGSGSQACPEVWAFGFRNPWRWSFDRETGDLWVGDVGQNAWEEVDRVTRGANYGWRLREATHCYNPSSNCPDPGSVQNGGVIVDPVTEYDHAVGQSITGGYVYRGAALPTLRGRYVFGDFASGRIWTHLPGAPNLEKAELLTTSINIASFGEGVDGELYLVSYANGQILQLQPGTGGGADTVPTSLAATGCVDPADPTRPAAGLIPYRPNAPFWSDGAAKERWIALPDGQGIGADANGDWSFPSRTVLMKSFRLDGKLVETRLFMRHPDGVWSGYTYEWNVAQTDATRVMGGRSRQVANQTWTYPSEQQCLQCHTEAAGRSLGLETAQQNGDFTYPQTGRTANQVVTLNLVGAISPAIPGAPAGQPQLKDPYGAAGAIGERARAYLHANCSPCHRPGGPTPTNLDLRHATALASTNACDAPPQQGDLGVGSARIVAPGSPARSVLLERIRRLDTYRMPPIGSTVVDGAGVQLLTEWITQLPGCQ
jgi:uncharacterized repeat protein (TIGR03806 family)